MKSQNFYDILEITIESSDKEVKDSFRSLAKKFHPDLNKGDKSCEEQFKLVLNAYEVLSNSEKRKIYNSDLLTHSTSKVVNNPYEPKFDNIDDALHILKDLVNELSKINVKDHKTNVNAIYTVINHILSPDFIVNVINRKDLSSQEIIVRNIAFCYQYLPVHIIKRIQIKLNLISFSDKKIDQFIRKLILKKKIFEWTENFILHI